MDRRRLGSVLVWEISPISAALLQPAVTVVVLDYPLLLLPDMLRRIVSKDFTLLVVVINAKKVSSFFPIY